MAKMGRPVGSTTRPQFYTYVTEEDRKQFVRWALKEAKKPDNLELAMWVGDQIFGKAAQPIGGPGDGPIQVQVGLTDQLAKVYGG